MVHNYLLEIGMEEIPARYLLSLSQQLKERMANFLNDNRLEFDAIQEYATPRRLAVLVTGLADKQADLSEQAKGPALKIAKDDQGQWTKAAQGFARGQGGTTDDLFVQDLNGEDYVFINKFQAGESSRDVLSGVESVVSGMTFPVTMHWHDYQINYIRPVHWLVSLLDQEVIPFDFAGVTASNGSRGHRFLGHDLVIAQADQYEASLEKEFVLADFHKRQAVIEAQIKEIADQNHWQVPIDQDLLEEVTAIVEWPTAFYGDFEEKYLEIPDMVLITAMKDHQRYFYALDQAGEKLQAIFISVRNGDANHLENVVRGNQKVLKARLEDALFFYKEDLKGSIETYVAKLDHVNEHYKLGSLADKQARVGQILDLLAVKVNQIDKNDLETAKMAAKMYKFDLMTGMVGEFDELQGQMGAWYARQFGQSDQVAQAIASQYLPTTAGGQLPITKAGALLAMADKLDSLVQYFAVDLIPTGSNDPYALRRQAMGVVGIMADQAWSLDLVDLFQDILAHFNLSDSELLNNLKEFMAARMEQQLAKLNLNFDIIEAVLAGDFLNVVHILEAGPVLQAFKNQEPQAYRNLVESLSRVLNLGLTVKEAKDLDLNLAQSESEQVLFDAVKDLNYEADSMAELLDEFKALVTPIGDFFENNMVNADQADIKDNRYALMAYLSRYVMQMMNPQKLISKF